MVKKKFVEEKHGQYVVLKEVYVRTNKVDW